MSAVAGVARRSSDVRWPRGSRVGALNGAPAPFAFALIVPLVVSVMVDVMVRLVVRLMVHLLVHLVVRLFPAGVPGGLVGYPRAY